MRRHLKIISNRLIIWLLMCPVCLAAQTHRGESPLRNDDGSVTFVLESPESRHVRISCDCALRDGKFNIDNESLRSVRMRADSNGRFTYTTPPLAPEIYTYRFKVRGQSVVDPANADSIRVGHGRRSVFIVPGSSVSDLCLADSLAGRTEMCEFWDSVTGKTRRMVTYLPPEYDSTGQSYPVLYLLHGINGNEQAWNDRGRAIQMVDKLIRQGKAEPMIVVMPDANPRKLIGQNEKVGIMKNLFHYAAWFHHDFERAFPQLDQFLSTRYRLSSDANMRAVAGLSAGANQAITLAQMYEDNFRYVGAFSPIVHRKQLITKSNSVFWIGTGKMDIFHFQSNRFARNLRQNQVPCVYHATKGGHTWRNWRAYLSEFMQFVFKDVGTEPFPFYSITYVRGTRFEIAVSK
ncbi:MAG: hypothetical protein IJP72_00015 [Bacteroidales bacterium]|nr:hypothetical protein [Bacteroidales bacterium]